MSEVIPSGEQNLSPDVLERFLSFTLSRSEEVESRIPNRQQYVGNYAVKATAQIVPVRAIDYEYFSEDQTSEEDPLPSASMGLYDAHNYKILSLSANMEGAFGSYGNMAFGNRLTDVASLNQVLDTIENLERDGLIYPKFMAETVGRGVDEVHEVRVPNEISRVWLQEFNEQYAGKDFTATVTVEEWLELPKASGSVYYRLDDPMGRDMWWQTISGKVDGVEYKDARHFHDKGFRNVLALTDASLHQSDGTLRPLDEARLVLVRLDRLKGNPQISLSRE